MKASKIIARLNELIKDNGGDIDLHFAINLGDFVLMDGKKCLRSIKCL